MKVNSKGMSLIEHFESIHDGDLSTIGLQPKQDPVGIWTVGFGRALYNKKTGKFLKGEKDKALAYAQYPKITVEEARAMLSDDLKLFAKNVTSLLKVELTDNQFSALVSFAYNCGIQNLITSTLLKFVNKGNFKAAADEFPRWNKASGKTLRGLTLRRAAERELFLES